MKNIMVQCCYLCAEGLFLYAFFWDKRNESPRTEGGTTVFDRFSNEPYSVQIRLGGADMRVKITLACEECKQRNYDTKKNKKNDPDRLELKKYCRFCKKHTLHKESK